MTRFSKWIAVLALFLGGSTLPFAPAEARDLRGRVGLGYNAQFSNMDVAGGVPGLAVRFNMSREMAFEAIFGINTGTVANSAVGGKFYINLHHENYVTFYSTVGLGYLTGGGSSGIELLGGIGAEFFIPGLESIGFSFEAGVSGENLTQSFAIKTYGDSFVTAGVRFYF
jgi:hypothetical protein